MDDWDYYHTGVDIGTDNIHPTLDHAVYPVTSGTIKRIDPLTPDYKAQLFILSDEDGYVYAYAHIKSPLFMRDYT